MTPSAGAPLAPSVVQRSCPTCAAAPANGDELASSRPRAEDVSAEERAENWRGFRADKIFFTYVRCSTCGQAYAPQYFSDAALGEVYHTMGDNTAGEDPQTLARTQSGYVEIVSAVAQPRGRWLDVGADIGLLAQALKRQPDVTAVDGLEPNVGVHDELSAAVGAEGRVFTDPSEVTGPYDGLAAIHVADHLLHPVPELTRWRDLLNPGGLLLIVVHNEQSVLRRLLNRKWPPYCLQHPQLYSPASMREFLERTGFDVLSVKRTKNYFSIDQFLAVGLAVLGVRYKRHERLRSLVVPLRLGNIAVVARKRVDAA